MSVPIQSISDLLFTQAGVQVFVKRDDLLHPVISGNKAYKLKFNLARAKQLGAQSVLTFGGAYSNHLHATAYAAKMEGLSCIGVVRGEQIVPLNPTLNDCVRWGMTLHPVSRALYQQKNTQAFKDLFDGIYPNSYWVPEGGANALGVQGAQTILQDVADDQFDYVVAACGTGTTLAGLIRAVEGRTQVIGVPVLKGAQWMQQEVEQWLGLSVHSATWQLWLDYHFGGYAKTNEVLNRFIAYADSQWAIPLDRVYTAKAFYGLIDQISKGFFPSGSRILFCHTGGLQGMRTTAINTN